MAKALVCGFEGFEEVECLTIVDVLRRGGVDVTLALPTAEVKAGRGVRVHGDALLKDVKDKIYDLVALPGGPGWKNLQADTTIRGIVEAHVNAGKYVGAICAAPAVCLGEWGLIKGRHATCYPALKDRLKDSIYTDKEPFVIDGQFITSRGPATAMRFAIELLMLLMGRETADKIASDLLLQ